MRDLASNAVQNNERLYYHAAHFLKLLDRWRVEREATAKNFRFIENNSWDATVYAELRDRGVTPLRIPIILARILRIIGFLEENKGRLVAKAKNFDLARARVATAILDEQNRTGERDLAILKAFTHTVISEMGGFLETYLCEETGLIKVRAVNPLHVLPEYAYALDEHKMHRFIVKMTWMSERGIMNTWPEKREEIETVVVGFKENEPYLQSGASGPGQGSAIVNDDLVNTSENLYRVIEHHERKSVIETYLRNVESGQGFGPMDQNMAVGMANQFYDTLKVEKKHKSKIVTSTCMADLVLLDSYEQKAQNGNFKITTIPAYNLTGKNIGVVGLLASLQEEYEQSRTTQLHALHSTAMSGWMYPEQSLSPTMKARIEKYGAAIGLNIEYRPGFPKPEKIQSHPLPVGEVERSQQALRDMDFVSMVDQSQIGLQSENAEPAILERQRRANMTTALRPLFRGIEQAEIIVGINTIDWAKVHYEPGKIIQLGGSASDAATFKLDPDFYSTEFEMFLLKTESEYAKAQRLKEKLWLMEFAVQPQYMPFVPMILENLDWPDDEKEKFLKAMGIEDMLDPVTQNKLKYLGAGDSMGGEGGPGIANGRFKAPGQAAAPRNNRTPAESYGAMSFN